MVGWLVGFGLVVCGLFVVVVGLQFCGDCFIHLSSSFHSSFGLAFAWWQVAADLAKKEPRLRPGFFFALKLSRDTGMRFCGLESAGSFW